ncbi:MAG: chloride channel protein [Bacteroidetes bacterium]|nr:chloride channel protein [Bacteroidota bacterium]MDA0904417.1 chloride channel protein [Bacteroidota bacterium]
MMTSRLEAAWKWMRSDKGMMLWAVLVGIVSGLLAVAMKQSVSGLRTVMFAIQSWLGGSWFLALGPMLGLVATAWVVQTLLKGDHPGPGIPATLHAISTRRGRMKRTWMFAPVITSILSVGFGGSGGLEAPAMQAGAAMGSEVASQTRRHFRRRLLLIGCAAAGSLAAMFKAPVAAIVFAVEVIMIDLTASSLVPILMASLASLLTAFVFFEGEDILTVPTLAAFDASRLPYYVLMGLATGVGSVVFSKVYMSSQQLIGQFKNPRTRMAMAGALVGVAVAALPPLFGEGYEIINALFRGYSDALIEDVWMLEGSMALPSLLGLLLLAGLLKPMLTGFTVGAGGVAGIFAPALFSGAVFGFAFALGLNGFVGPTTMPIGNSVLGGLCGMMAGVLHAPLTAIFLATELSGGYGLFVPLMLTSAISFSTSRALMRHSIYTRELAERGELLTHDKDRTVLTLMNLKEELEQDFTPVQAHWNLGQLVEVVAQSQRNLHPVVDGEGHLLGIVDLQDIRQVMFDRDQYLSLRVVDLMTLPLAEVQWEDKMDDVMAKFEQCGAWNLPVVEDGRYVGFVSRSRLFNAYRKWLKATSLD